ncbi:MAG: aldo/keto reductase [Chloroflexi bacterium]|nr:aldo/keto reductase [Chloroflexota bacterium]
MRYKLLGRSGLRVSELALGTMTFGEAWGWGAPKDDSRRIFDRFAEAGGNFIDTANRYTDGHAEEFVGEFIAADRDHFVVATKYSLSMNPADPNASGNQRKNMIRALEASLKRMNTDYVDLYWLHAWDYTTPVDEIMRAFDDLVTSGKVMYIGISDSPAWVIARAQTLAELRGWAPFIGLQIEYSLVQRDPERDLLPMARALDIGVAAWSPLGGGVLTGKYNRQTDEARRMRGTSERNLTIAAALGQIADDIGRPPTQVAINWVRQQTSVPSSPVNAPSHTPIIPILGARKFDQFAQNLGCLEFELTAEQVARLNEISQIELGWPHDFLTAEGVRRMVYGNSASTLDNHHRA